MKHSGNLAGVLWLLLGVSVVAAAAPEGGAGVQLGAKQVIEANAKARGGLASWKALNAVRLSGELQALTVQPDAVLRAVDPKQAKFVESTMTKEELEPYAIKLPIRIERKRVLRQRIEIDQADSTSVQVFDGKEGWKLRPYRAHKGAEPYTKDELVLAKSQPPEIDPRCSRQPLARARWKWWAPRI